MIRFRFDPDSSSIVLRATVKHRLSHYATLVLDLGASYTQLPRRVIEAIGCRIPKKTKRVRVVTAGGVKRAPLVQIRQLTALNCTVRNLDVLCLDLPPEAKVDGLLGLNFLRHFNLHLKFKEGIIEIQ
jgi:predicted aspartyl protease